jgi:hypothetical protein
MTYRTLILGRLTLVLSLALGTAAACGGGSDVADALGGAGGTDGAGGTSSGGTPATGGTPNSTGGTPAAEGGNAGEGGSGDGPGEPNVPDGPTICQGDEDCTDFGQVCAGFRHVCVDCVNNVDCGEGEVCVHSECEMRGSCEDSLDCPSLDLVCVETGGGPGPQQGLCLECAGTEDCGEEESCVDNACVRGCASDKDCTPLGLLCNFESGSCVECLASDRCAEGEYCGDGTCHEAVCTPGDSVCLGEGIAICNENGSGYGDVDPCFNGACEVDGGEAVCVQDNDFPNK